jgi:hypothetical protein
MQDSYRAETVVQASATATWLPTVLFMAPDDGGDGDGDGDGGSGGSDPSTFLPLFATTKLEAHRGGD